jgi:hypothetical protein
MSHYDSLICRCAGAFQSPSGRRRPFSSRARLIRLTASCRGRRVQGPRRVAFSNISFHPKAIVLFPTYLTDPLICGGFGMFGIAQALRLLRVLVAVGVGGP